LPPIYCDFVAISCEV